MTTYVTRRLFSGLSGVNQTDVNHVREIEFDIIYILLAIPSATLPTIHREIMP